MSNFSVEGGGLCFCQFMTCKGIWFKPEVKMTHFKAFMASVD